MPWGAHGSVLQVVLLGRWSETVSLDGFNREIQRELAALVVLGQILENREHVVFFVAGEQLKLAGCNGKRAGHDLKRKTYW